MVCVFRYAPFYTNQSPLLPSGDLQRYAKKRNMKAPDRKTVSQLEKLPNIGKAIGKDLRLIGVDHPQELIGKSAFQLYNLLCNKKGQRIDHCVIDVFMSAIDYMEGGEPQPWWAFTEKRKQILNEKEKGEIK